MNDTRDTTVWLWCRDETPHGMTRVLRSDPELTDPTTRPVLFLHGWGSPPTRYAGLLEHYLTDRRPVIAPTLPGFAGSAPAPGPPHHVAAARAAHLLSDTSAPATVIAHSFGAAVAVHLATTRPDLIHELILLCPVGACADKPTIWSMPLSVIKDGGLARNAYRTMNTLHQAAKHPAQYVRTAHAARTANLAQVVSDLAAQFPVTVMNATHDGIVAPFHPSGAQVLNLPGTHRVPVNEPARVLTLLYPDTRPVPPSPTPTRPGPVVMVRRFADTTRATLQSHARTATGRAARLRPRFLHVPSRATT